MLSTDFVTANVQQGTGGIDASIGFETLRSGRTRAAPMNDSFTFWRPFVNEAVPSECIPRRPGHLEKLRISLKWALRWSGRSCRARNCHDRKSLWWPQVATTSRAGSTPFRPTPRPASGTGDWLGGDAGGFFSRAGFGPVDAIGLTACGHTMGSVHHVTFSSLCQESIGLPLFGRGGGKGNPDSSASDPQPFAQGGFPDVVPESAVNENNTNGGMNFDTSRGVFDPMVVHEYIDGTGNRGGPLVTTENVTTQSDLEALRVIRMRP